MAMEKQKRLLMVLLGRSRRGDLDWRPSLDDGTFQVSLKDITVRIEEPKDRPEYTISVLNSVGQEVEAFGPGALAESGATQTWVNHFRDLHDLARRTALGTDKVLDDLLKSLGGSG